MVKKLREIIDDIVLWALFFYLLIEAFICKILRKKSTLDKVCEYD